MKILVVYYSLSGKTKTVAHELAKSLSADIEKIQDKKSRKGFWRHILAGFEAYKKRSTTITSSKFNPADYDLVIIGTPVWAADMACAVRAWLEEHKDALKYVAFFVTMGSGGATKTFKAMQHLIHKKPVATMALTDKNITRNNYLQQLDDFLIKLGMKE